jgi:hypothetical protein
VIGAVLRHVPPWVLWRVRWSLLRLEPVLTRLGITPPQRWRGGKSPFRYLSGEGISAIRRQVSLMPECLLQIREVRQILARDRVRHFIAHGEMRRYDGAGASVAHNTIDYNIDGATSAPDLDRPSIMVNVVSGIERVWKEKADLDVLSIGPRSEIEIFALMAAGFGANRIQALDLFSYSPYVDIGDMHAMSYADASFDIVFVGWVLSYSRDQAAAAREILRVCRDRAIVVLAGDYSDESRDNPAFNNENTHMKSCEQLLGLFSGHVGRVYFRHDPDPPRAFMVMTVFEARKP